MHRPPWFIVPFAFCALFATTVARGQETPPSSPPREPGVPPASPAVKDTPPIGPAPVGVGSDLAADRLGGPNGAPRGGASHAEQRFEELERRLRLLEEKDATPAHGAEPKKSSDKWGAPTALALVYGPEGVGIASADGKFQFRFRPTIQADARFFFDGGTNTFLLRRLRPTLEGTLFEYFDWRIMPDFAVTPTVQEAFVNVRIFKEIQLRGGKFKSPVGLERSFNAADMPFIERGLPTNLVPDRDIGIQLHGDVLGGTLVYSSAILNGSADSVNGDGDNNDKKDVAGRIMLRPFQPTFVTALRKLGLGIAATRGTHAGALPPFRTPVGSTFFQFAEGVSAGGTHRRIAPQAYFYLGPLGVFGEYVRSTQIVVLPGLSTRLDHDVWQVAASFFVTGEENSPGAVTPKHALDLHKLGFGAVEIVARFGELYVDRDAFRLGLADATRSARKATNLSVGVNWHVARNVKAMLDFDRTSFEGGAGTGDRPSESLILARMQAAF